MKISKEKAKRISILFFGVGTWGVGMSLFLNSNFLLFLSGINLALGTIFIIIYKQLHAKNEYQ